MFISKRTEKFISKLSPNEDFKIGPQLTRLYEFGDGNVIDVICDIVCYTPDSIDIKTEYGSMLKDLNLTGLISELVDYLFDYPGDYDSEVISYGNWLIGLTIRNDRFWEEYNRKYLKTENWQSGIAPDC